jgi:hypothetical protein
MYDTYNLTNLESLIESRHGSPGPAQYDDKEGMKLVHDHSPEWT